MSTPNLPDLLTPAEVAEKFRVDPKTVSRWAIAGKIRSTRTPGGHHRFRRDHIEALLAGPVKLVAHKGGVYRIRGGIKEGAAWGPATDDLTSWFAFRVDVAGGKATRFASRAAALDFLRQETGE